MGTEATALFSATRRAVLGLLFGHPDRQYYLREIAEHAGSGMAQVQRELTRLTAAGILLRIERGRHVYFQANPASPIFAELRAIVAKTVGVGDVLREALEPLAERIAAAFVYGSIARGDDSEQSDVDLMVIGEVSFAEVVEAIRPAEAQIQRPVNPTVYSPSELEQKLAERHHFLTQVWSSEKLPLIGDPDDAATLPRE